MFRWFVSACVLIFAAGTAAAADKKPDPLVELLAKLREPVKLIEEPATLSLGELLTRFGKDHGIRFVMNDSTFKSHGVPDVQSGKPRINSRLTGIRLGKALDLLLKDLDDSKPVCLIRKDHIEIAPHNVAELETKSFDTPGPLVSAVFKEKPLNEAMAELADDYDATIIVAPQTGDARMAFVNARLLNVPLQTALELLAVQTDLRVVKRKNAYLITTPDAANGLRDDEMQKERMRAEVRLLRAGKLPAPPAPPEPPKPDK
jgi:hypothetical protein